MSIEDYKEAGYLISVHISQAIIDKAEADVRQAYINPLDTLADTTVPGVAREALMELTYLLCLQRSIFATRSGAKEKTAANSYTPTRWDLLSQCSSVCVLKMGAFAESAHVLRWEKKVKDICGILFNTNFLSL